MSAQQNQLKDLTEGQFREFSNSYSYKPVSLGSREEFCSVTLFFTCLHSHSESHIPECFAVPGGVQSRGRDGGRASGQQQLSVDHQPPQQAVPGPGAQPRPLPSDRVLDDPEVPPPPPPPVVMSQCAAVLAVNLLLPQEPESGRQGGAGVGETCDLFGRRDSPGPHSAAQWDQDTSCVSPGGGRS